MAKRIVLLVGQADVAHRSTTRTAAGRSDTNSTQLRDILPPDAVGAMPKGTALVMPAGRRPTMVTLRPYYRSSYPQLVDDSISEARAELARRLGHLVP